MYVCINCCNCAVVGCCPLLSCENFCLKSASSKSLTIISSTEIKTSIEELLSFILPIEYFPSLPNVGFSNNF